MLGIGTTEEVRDVNLDGEGAGWRCSWKGLLQRLLWSLWSSGVIVPLLIAVWEPGVGSL